MSAGLIGLEHEQLAPPLARLLEQAAADSLGPKPWRLRKATEARELCALSQRSPRLELIGLDLRTELRALLRLKVPVAVRPDPQGELEVVHGADLALIYPVEALRGALPGYAFVRVLRPTGIRDCSSCPGRGTRT